MNTVIILAGGKGSRMNAGINKAYLPLHNRPILTYTVEAFDKNEMVDEIILVVGENEESLFRSKVLVKSKGSKVKKIVTGGYERQDSVYNGLAAIDSSCDIVLIHDGARPFVSSSVIQRCIDGALKYGAVTTAVPIKETIKIVRKPNLIDYTPDRRNIWVTQTPQAFKRNIIIDAHTNAKNRDIKGTDDAMLVENMGLEVRVIEGDYDNIKITTPEDLIIAEAIVNYKRKSVL